MREMAQASVRQREGEMVALRKQLERAERQQRLLVDQLTGERRANAEATAELVALRGMAGEYHVMRAEHAAALEMLGEKEEELDAARASIG